MVEIQNDSLLFRFPEVHPDASMTIDFQRTLRLPDDNREYPLPPGLGRFPLRHTDDFASKLPASWSSHGGVFLPMYQAEALWIRFSSTYPMAIKIAAGKINAVTGDGWSDALHDSPQDYVVAPEQPWIDGFAIGPERVRQFVAMPLGAGYTAEEQITGVGEFGGVQLLVRPMRGERYTELRAPRMALADSTALVCMSVSADFGLAPGGLLRQQIYADDYGIDAWDRQVQSRCFVHILNSQQYRQVTGKRPPHEPPTAQAYTQANLPWFEYFNADMKPVAGSEVLGKLDSVAALGVKKSQEPLLQNDPITPSVVVPLASGARPVREGEF